MTRMSQVIRIKIPASLTIWKSRQNFIAVAKDKATVNVLMPYVGKIVEVEISGITVQTRLVKLKQKETYYIGVFLPKRLAPTWEKLRQKSNEYNAVIVITERNDGEQT